MRDKPFLNPCYLLVNKLFVSTNVIMVFLIILPSSLSADALESAIKFSPEDAVLVA